MSTQNNKKKKKSAQRPTELLQEVQSNISSLSLAEAIASVNAAKKAIESLKLEQKKAQEQLLLAKASTETDKISKDQSEYDKIGYWQQRYQSERDYDWYLSFDELKPILLPDLDLVKKSCASQGEILVAGCGNSSLCEDLWNSGYRRICGIDYASNVVEMMEQRRIAQKMDGLAYRAADATSMPATMHGTCFAIIDKGTLDAIMSGGWDSKKEGLGGREDVNSVGTPALYLKNMWQVLQPKGLFILVTTMPPKVFEELLRLSEVTAIVKDYSSCRYQSIANASRGVIHYFCLTKEDSPSSNTTVNVLPEEVQKLLRETELALQQLQSARMKVEEQSNVAKTLVDDISVAEQKISELSGRLGGDWKEDLLGNVDDEDPFTEFPEDSEEPKNAENREIAMESDMKKRGHETRSSVKIHLEIVDAPNVVFTNSRLLVRYTISAGEFEDGDYISLHEGEYSSNKDVLDVMTNVTTDTFEYLDPPILQSSGLYVGESHLTLPSWGGIFHIRYHRVHIFPNGRSVMRNNVMLAHSTSISLCTACNFLGHVSEEISVRSLWRSMGCRKPITSQQYPGLVCVVETLSNISILNFTIRGRSACHMSKLQLWAMSLEKKTWIALEFDTLEISTGILSTRHLTFSIPSLQDNGWDVLCDATGGFYATMQTSQAQENDCIIVRVPFHPNVIDENENNGRVNEIQAKDVSINCRCCGMAVMRADSLMCREMPVGHFDHMMHSFLCSEDAPAIPLSSSDISPVSGLMLTHDAYLCLPSADLSPASVTCHCKTYQSLLDKIVGDRSFFPQAGHMTKQCCGSAFQAVDISTCLVNCARCGILLGDGYIGSDSEDHSTGELSSHAGGSQFNVSDLRDVKLLRDKIVISSDSLEVKSSVGTYKTLSCEQVLSKIILKICALYRVSVFYMFVSDAEDAPNTEGILIRLVSQRSAFCIIDNFQIEEDRNCTEVQCSNAIKVSLKYTPITTKPQLQDEQLLPLCYDDFIQIRQVLEERRKYIQNSIVPNEFTSFLLT